MQADGAITRPDGAPEPREAAEVAAEAAETHQRGEQSRVDMMRAYAVTTGCRRQLLLAAPSS